MSELEPAAEERVALPVRLYRSEMLRRWGPLYYLSGLWLLFRRLAMTEPSAERVRQAAERGPVVYVLRTRSDIDYLALNEVLRRRRLPLAAFGTAVKTQAFMPVLDLVRSASNGIRWWLRQGRLPHPVESGFLQQLVLAGRNAAVFLHLETDWRDLFRPPDHPDPIAALLDAQERSERPIQVLPVAVIWGRPPGRARPAGVQAVLGSDEDPGSLARAFSMAFGLRRAMVEIGEPVDLAEYLERYREEPARRRTKRLQLLLRRYIYREQQVVRGPSTRSHRWVRQRVLRSARIRRLLEDETEATGRSAESLQEEVVKLYDKMAARFSYPWVVVAKTVVNAFWSRIYSGIDVGEEDIERVRQAKREGVCVLVPCHKSHIDYMLLSTVLDSHDIVIPHVVAGDNLSFFPLGAVLRRLGAFFIRRSFRGERVFPAVFETYLAHLMREGYTVEFFIEGGRSRTGKLLPPRLGVLGLTVEAGLEARVGRQTLSEVTWLPVSISYERVAEETPYARELAGGEKQPESLSEVVKAGGVLAQRYGRVYVRMGEPLRMSEFLAEQPASWEKLDRDHKKEALTLLGERILSRIADRVVVLPTGIVALALLAQSTPEVDAGTLELRTRSFRALLDRAGAEPSKVLASSRKALGDALSRFLREGKVERELSPGGGVRFRVVPEQRISLEYYKNALLHYLLPGALAAGVIRALPPGPFSADDLRPDFEQQLFVFRYEFVLDPEIDWEAMLETGLEQLRHHGAIGPAPDGPEGALVLLDRRLNDELAELVLNFQESYFAALRGLQLLQAKDVPPDELPAALREVAEKLLAVADISRPEALNLLNLKNAARALREEGIYQHRSGGAGLELDVQAHQEYLALFRRLILR